MNRKQFLPWLLIVLALIVLVPANVILLTQDKKTVPEQWREDGMTIDAEDMTPSGFSRIGERYIGQSSRYLSRRDMDFFCLYAPTHKQEDHFPVRIYRIWEDGSALNDGRGPVFDAYFTDPEFNTVFYWNYVSPVPGQHLECGKKSFADYNDDLLFDSYRDQDKKQDFIRFNDKWLAAEEESYHETDKTYHAKAGGIEYVFDRSAGKWLKKE